MYFLRSSFRTLMEMLGAIQTLLGDQNFKKLLVNQDSETRDLFDRLARAMAEGHPALKEVRNDIGGHVLLQRTSSSLTKSKRARIRTGKKLLILLRSPS
jgi:hypothetical protein